MFLSAFALLALFVASIGLYGVMSYLVSQRTHEFGIRMAVGATRGSVLALVLKEGVKLAGMGVAIGLAAAALLGRLIASLLYGVKPLDAITLGGSRFCSLRWRSSPATSPPAARPMPTRWSR